MENQRTVLLPKLIKIVNEISNITEFKCTIKQQCRHVVRTLRLLLPLFEDLLKTKDRVPENIVKALVLLMDALVKAKDLLKLCSHGSKIYKVLETEKMMYKFQELAGHFTKALSEISLNKLDISEELKQKVELVQIQFARAQEEFDTFDLELFDDLLRISNQTNEVIPEDFRCPISLDLMRDPVIISTGQTYERACIKKWLDRGHGTCPKTQQILTSTALIPNHALSNLISNWCVANGMEPPTRFGSLRLCKTVSTTCFAGVELEPLFHQLISNKIEDQRSAAGEIRRLAKHSSESRVRIAGAGAIPLLTELLTANDNLIQEHAVTALLNLSIVENNKAIIISSGAIPSILHVLKYGSMEARENAATTFFSLSSVYDYKGIIGTSGVIPALVALLSEGRRRGKVDAAAALFNLCLYSGNKKRAVKAGAVHILMIMLTEPDSGMVDEALAIMAILASHHDARTIIGILDTLPIFVELVKNGSLLSRENAVVVLLHLCSGDPQHLSEAILCGIYDPLLDLAENGTIRGKQKAAQLLELIG